MASNRSVNYIPRYMPCGYAEDECADTKLRKVKTPKGKLPSIVKTKKVTHCGGRRVKTSLKIKW